MGGLRKAASIQFTLKSKETGLPVNRCDIANQLFEDTYHPDEEEFLYLYLDPQGWICISHEDGETATIEREGKYIICFSIGTDTYEILY